MHVLVTGAFGFVGRNLSRHLLAHGHRLLALDVARQDLGAYDEFYAWEQLGGIDWARVDVVVHLAGKSHDIRNASDAQSYFDVNVGLTKKIVDASSDGWLPAGGGAASCTPKVFILFSSVKAAADAVEGVLTEEATPKPQTPYGQSKLQAERIVETLVGGRPLHVRSYVLRPCMIHGPGNKGNLNLLYDVIRKGLPWPLGAYENRRSFASIDNVCAVVEGLLSTDAPSGVYQVADDEALSTNELIRTMAAAMGRRPRVVNVPTAAVRALARLGDVARLPLNSDRLRKLTESYEVSNAKIKSALGWAQMPLRAAEGLKIAVESFGRS